MNYMAVLPNKPQIIGLITPEVFDGTSFKYKDEIELCDALEIRYDLFDDPMEPKNYAEIIRETFNDTEIIGTIRLERDGGSFSDSLIEKRNTILFELMMLGEWDWVDLEYENIDFLPKLLRGARETNTHVITSHHNFDGAYMKEEYVAMAMEMTLAGTDAVKYSVMVTEEDELKALYGFVKENTDRKISIPLMSAFSMGEFAQDTRVKMPTLGAPYTYGFFGDIPPVSGQVSVKKLNQKLKIG